MAMYRTTTGDNPLEMPAIEVYYEDLDEALRDALGAAVSPSQATIRGKQSPSAGKPASMTRCSPTPCTGPAPGRRTLPPPSPSRSSTPTRSEIHVPAIPAIPATAERGIVNTTTTEALTGSTLLGAVSEHYASTLMTAVIRAGAPGRVIRGHYTPGTDAAREGLHARWSFVGCKCRGRPCASSACRPVRASC